MKINRRRQKNVFHSVDESKKNIEHTTQFSCKRFACLHQNDKRHYSALGFDRILFRKMDLSATPLN